MALGGHVRQRRPGPRPRDSNSEPPGRLWGSARWHWRGGSGSIRAPSDDGRLDGGSPVRPPWRFLQGSLHPHSLAMSLTDLRHVISLSQFGLRATTLVNGELWLRCAAVPRRL